MYVLTPILPGQPAVTDFWACLEKRPLPGELAAYLQGHWLPGLAAAQIHLEATPLLRHEYLRLHVFGRVLHDLARQGWHFVAVAPVVPGGSQRLGATPPDSADWAGRPPENTARPTRDEVKKLLQQALVAHREEQLLEPAVQRFVRRLERPRRHAGRLVSVRSLLADPRLLATDLQNALADPTPAQRDERLLNLVKPYLQAATADDVDEYTGLPLLDIWRYCRYTWSLPFQTQPGRRMFYLVRDRARPGHPIMGIGALGSSVVQLTVRDEYIGWSLEALCDCSDPAPRLRALAAELDRAIGEIYHLDFLAEGVLHETDLAAPTPAALDRLSAYANQQPLASRERQKQLLDLVAEAQTPLFRRKRAETLGALLAAKNIFASVEHLSADLQLLELLKIREGKQAIRTAIRSIKKRRVAASMMEITTCGAVPPYGELLGGKLIAMLMASPQVVGDYKKRYHSIASVIASRMQGENLTRDADLVLLGTTSLYYTGSSQYNRVKFPTANGSVSYKEIGKTKGYGSVHLTRGTYLAIQEFLAEEPSIRQQSHTFAAGVNYKLRSIAACFTALGLQALQQHSNPRLVYLLPLANNWQDYLLGVAQEPDWVYDDVEKPELETNEIIIYWKKRWLLNRTKNPDILNRLLVANTLASLEREVEQDTVPKSKAQTSFFFRHE